MEGFLFKQMQVFQSLNLGFVSLHLAAKYNGLASFFILKLLLELFKTNPELSRILFHVFISVYILVGPLIQKTIHLLSWDRVACSLARVGRFQLLKVTFNLGNVIPEVQIIIINRIN